MTPATAEKAKPENPDTSPPRKVAIVSTRMVNSLIVGRSLEYPHVPNFSSIQDCFFPDCADRLFTAAAKEGYHRHASGSVSYVTLRLARAVAAKLYAVLGK